MKLYHKPKRLLIRVLNATIITFVLIKYGIFIFSLNILHFLSLYSTSTYLRLLSKLDQGDFTGLLFQLCFRIILGTERYVSI